MIIRAVKRNGFTLVELLIVVAIVAILAAVALPAYNSQILKSKRNLGKSELLELAGRQERFYTQNGYYGKIADITDSTGTTYYTDDNVYGVTVACLNTSGGAAVCGTATAQVFTLTASPNSITDSYCGNLTLTQAGQKGISGDASHFDACWN